MRRLAPLSLRLAGWCLALGMLASCAETLGAEPTSLGKFLLCRHRLSDRCQSAKGQCRSLTAETQTVELLELPDQTLRWNTGGQTVMVGRRVGRRFVMQSVAPVAAELCDCPAQVTERLVGELTEARAVMPRCLFTEADSGCGEPPAESAFFVDGPPAPDGWLEGAEPLPGHPAFGSLRALVTVSVAVEPPADRPCSCNACEGRFELSGVQ